MFYPTYQTRCCHRTFLCTQRPSSGRRAGHIHAGDGGAEKALWRRAAACRSRDDDDLCLREHLSLCLHWGDGEFGELSVEFLRSAAMDHGRCFKRYSFISVERQYEAILGFLRDHNLGRVDCFIYGDTHQAGIYQRKGGPLAMNAGSFMRESKKVPV